MPKTLIALAAAMLAVPANATILTYDVQGGVTNFKVLVQSYGDRVTTSPDANDHSYAFGTEGTTPNVVVDYGTPGEDPNLWTTGYGNLTNVMFNDTDGDTTMTTRLTADSGFLVRLFGFDLASFLGGGQTIQGLTVTDLATSNVLFSQGSTFVSGTTRNVFDFSANPLTGAQLQLVVNLTGLGNVSDDIGLDNLRFGQAAVAVGGIPEPGTWALMIGGFGLVGAAMRRRGGAATVSA